MISNNNVYFCKLNNKSPLKICVMDKRFDLNTDKELAYTICEEINRQFWKLERHVDGDDLSAQALEERLSSLAVCDSEPSSRSITFLKTRMATKISIIIMTTKTSSLSL